MDKFPLAGKKFSIAMNNGLKVTNGYSNDGKTILVEFLSGDLNGTKMEVPFSWTKVGDLAFLISWQENDGSTVVHYDDFKEKISRAFYTTMKGDFYVMEGEIS